MDERVNYQTRVLTVLVGVNTTLPGFREERQNYQLPMLEVEPFAELTKRETSRHRMSLLEAWLDKPDAANLLRSDFRLLAFATMDRMARTWQLIAQQETSNKPEEEYLRDAHFGAVPPAPSGTPVSFVKTSFEGASKIANVLYRMGVEIPGDDIKFDKLGKVRQVAQALGRSAILTEESTFYAMLTTTGNYTRNSTTNDNDVGANTGTTTFNVVGLDNAIATVSTAKDRKSGAYLGYQADTIVVPPKMEMPIKQLLMSGDLVRSNSAATEVRGMGTYNPYRGVFDKIIVTPWFGTSYQWAIFDSKVQSIMFQVVDPWTILQEN